MRLQSFCLDFSVNSGVIYSSNPELHKLAVLFAENELADKINFADYSKVLLVAEVDDSGKPTRVVGICCEQIVPDIPVFHVLSEEAGSVLIDRTRSYLQDVRRHSGGLVFLHIAKREAEESRCPSWRKLLKSVGAENANRWGIRC